MKREKGEQLSCKGCGEGASQGTANGNRERQPATERWKRKKRQDRGRRRLSTESREQSGSVVMGLFVHKLSMIL